MDIVAGLVKLLLPVRTRFSLMAIRLPVKSLHTMVVHARTTTLGLDPMLAFFDKIFISPPTGILNNLLIPRQMRSQ